MEDYNKKFQKSLFFIVHMLSIFDFCSAQEIKEKPIVVTIPSYKNASIFKKNIDSVFAQAYDNYHIIYRDDCSPDGTGDLVEQYVQNHPLKDKVTVIKNDVRIGALANLYHMIHACDPNAIIIALDGDDWLPDEYVFQKINAIYSSGDIWLTYGQFKLYPDGQKGWASPMPESIVKNNAFREYEHLPTHLRTFYAWLFQAIKLEDLLYLGDFYTMTWDMAMMFPMIEMAGERHHCFVDDILYIYNDENSLSDHRISRQLQAYLAQLVRAKKRYQRLPEKPFVKNLNDVKTDVLIFSFNKPNVLSDVINSIETNVVGVHDIHIMYQAPNNEVLEQYQAVIEKYPACHFYKLAPNAADFRPTLISVFDQLQGDYVLFSKGDTIFTVNVSLSDCIEMLEKTKAYAFYFNLATSQINQISSPVLHPVSITSDVDAWNFYMARDVWSSANSVDSVLHKKDAVLKGFVHAQYMPNPEGFELAWANQGNLDRVGLCFFSPRTKRVA